MALVYGLFTGGFFCVVLYEAGWVTSASGLWMVMILVSGVATLLLGALAAAHGVGSGPGGDYDADFGSDDSGGGCGGADV
ncbi:hypothetical protein [Streptomyces sp. GC420]|uniref:hypothetical protein n=1 Tax=Streptomyces sp. GC420 TaxID=2697568 RepID=UPI001414F24B|nr:hypothetical protein [Streptomyces sp. GC420]NBM14623.1 hypothetical protein [Streptomyces sp. GC420]